MTKTDTNIIMGKYRKLEEGGVLGLYGRNLSDVSHTMYYGLYALQHRGQTSCGLVLNDSREMTEAKGRGLVAEVIEPSLNKLIGSIGVGHVKYGQSAGGEILPLNSIYLKGTLTVSLGGTISNSEKLKEELENEGGIFRSGSDAEILAHLIARERTQTGSVERAVLRVMDIIEGAYAALVMSPEKLLAFRDKDGLRPLSLGVIGNDAEEANLNDKDIIFASEDVAFSAMGGVKVRDIRPGELMAVHNQGVAVYPPNKKTEPRTCIYEYMYFARPDSIIDGKSVYLARMNAGSELYKACPAEADVVIGVPSAGLHYALGYARESGIPFGDGLIRNYYVGRTSDHESMMHEASLSVKLNVMRAAVEGLRVALVDDSMVMGATAKRLVAKLKESGAKEVHLRIACPRFASPCPYSPSLSTTLYLKTDEEICAMTGADSVGFLPIECLDKIGLSENCCKGCFIAAD